MAEGPRYHVPYRRRREGKTDYRKRLALLKSRKVRAVVRRSLSGMTVQMVDFGNIGDKVLAQASYRDLEKMGWKRSLKGTSASYLTGLLAGKRALESDIDEAVLDIGLNEPVRGSRVFATLKGLLDAGVEIPHGEGIFPAEERIQGGSENEEKFQKDFEAMKTKILEM
jgi:large subunit ribosomal protein L18